MLPKVVVGAFWSSEGHTNDRIIPKHCRGQSTIIGKHSSRHCVGTWWNLTFSRVGVAGRYSEVAWGNHCVGAFVYVSPIKLLSLQPDMQFRCCVRIKTCRNGCVPWFVAFYASWFLVLRCLPNFSSILHFLFQYKIILADQSLLVNSPSTSFNNHCTTREAVGSCARLHSALWVDVLTC